MLSLFLFCVIVKPTDLGDYVMENINELFGVSLGYNVFFEMAAIPLNLIMVGYLLIAYKNERTKTNKAFTLQSMGVTVATFFNVFAAVVTSMGPDVSVGFHMFINSLDGVMTCLSAAGFVYYIASYLKSNSSRRRVYQVLITELVFYILILLINIKTHSVALYLEDGTLVHGPLFNVMAYGFPMFSLVLGATLLFLHRNSFRLMQINALFMALVSIAVIMLFQMFFMPKVLIVYFAVTLGEIIMFLALESPDHARLVEAKRKLEMIQNANLEEEMSEEMQKQQILVQEMTMDIRNGEWRDPLDWLSNEKIRKINKPKRSEERGKGPRVSRGEGVIMVVDDNQSVIEQTRRALRGSFEVIGILSGEEALDQLDTYKPELVLLDTFMPGMDGEEVLRRIKKSKHLHDIPVVMLDNESDPEMELNVFRQGAEDYIRKPFAPAVLLHRVNRIVNFRRLEKNLNEQVIRQTKRTGRLSREIMEALSNTVEAKDLYTSGHSRRVAELAAELARRAGKTDTEMRDIFACGLLHDIGQVGISEKVVNKEGKLTPEEFEEMRRHPIIGYDILKTISTMPGLARGARWHHERYDGKGYPDGLSEDSIPEEARIIAVCDTFDAMTTARTYSSIRPLKEVRQEFLRCRGTQFDPYYADLMVQIIDEKIEKMNESEN